MIKNSHFVFMARKVIISILEVFLVYVDINGTVTIILYLTDIMSDSNNYIHYSTVLEYIALFQSLSG